MTNERNETQLRSEAPVRSEKLINDALARLRTSVEIPPVDPAREQALLAAFDAHWTQPRPRHSPWAWMSAAALIAITVSLNWLVVRNSAQIEHVVPEPAGDLTGFVPWPGANAFPRFESGSLVRVDLPVSALPMLGLSAPLSAAAEVQAEIIVGQDGFARAVRLVQ